MPRIGVVPRCRGSANRRFVTGGLRRGDWSNRPRGLLASIAESGGARSVQDATGVRMLIEVLRATRCVIASGQLNRRRACTRPSPCIHQDTETHDSKAHDDQKQATAHGMETFTLNTAVSPERFFDRDCRARRCQLPTWTAVCARGNKCSHTRLAKRWYRRYES